ncbi:hypothetical protein GCM10023196_091790 [Actinoallomurus vinaceus]|uniref:Uncharacterized protein n=2 Tax=Actinoallomurus vinaceus TaxID=1080074 RepID=A0ABP8URF4_9ACTN
MALGLTLGVAAGRASAETEDWKQSPLPVSDANIVTIAQPDQHTTWAAGATVTAVPGKEGALMFKPLLLAKDERTDQGWKVVSIPDDTTYNRINAMSTRGPDDAWLVGDNDTRAGSGNAILTEHWDGTAWYKVTAPVPADTVSAGFLSVAAVGPNDAWAAGWRQTQDSVPGLLEHWDGTAWNQAALPAGTDDLILNAVAATAADDIWVAGYHNSTDQPALLHGDGHSWQLVNLPKTGRYGELNTLAVGGRNDVWAAGRTALTATDGGSPLLEHWNGRSWQAVKAPGTGEVRGAALTSRGLTLVGDHLDGPAPYGWRFDGTQWESLGLPTFGSENTSLLAVADTRDGLVSVGAYKNADEYLVHPLMLTSTAP